MQPAAHCLSSRLPPPQVEPFATRCPLSCSNQAGVMRWIDSMLMHVAPNEGMQLDLPDSRRQNMGQFKQPVSEGERDVKSEDMQQAPGTNPGEIKI